MNAIQPLTLSSIPTLLLVNEAANNGAATRKWASVATDVLARLPPDTETITYRPGVDLEALLRTRLRPGEVHAIVSAGGDGSLHYLLNTLMELGAEISANVYVGGIGLGSSNDFHKPVGPIIRGVPVRIDPTTTIRADVGQVRYEGANGHWLTRYFLINASLGITAQANHLFNEGDWFIRLMKNRWVGLTIQYTALKTILSYQDQSLALRVDDGPAETLRLTNLNLLKSPYVSGSFRYEQPIQPDDGQFGLNYCHNLTLPETLRLMMDLQRGRFAGKPKRVSAFVRKLHVASAGYLPLEMDGEVVLTRNCTINLLPRAIHLMR